MLDGNARFNLATFVTTWMDEEADRLYAATFDKNMVDKDEYPQTAEVESRCLRDARRPVARTARGESVGDMDHPWSEGCMLGRARPQAPVAEGAPGGRAGRRIGRTS